MVLCNRSQVERSNSEPVDDYVIVSFLILVRAPLSIQT